jgi:hypothetical protein
MSSVLIATSSSDGTTSHLSERSEIKRLLHEGIKKLKSDGWGDDEPRIQKLNLILDLLEKDDVETAYVALADFVHQHSSSEANEAFDMLEWPGSKDY